MKTLSEILANSREKELFDLIEKLESQEVNDKIQIVDTDLDHDEYDQEYGYKLFHAEGYLFDVVKNKIYSEQDENKFEWDYIFEDTAYDGFKNCTVKKAIELVKIEML